MLRPLFSTIVTYCLQKADSPSTKRTKNRPKANSATDSTQRKTPLPSGTASLAGNAPLAPPGGVAEAPGTPSHSRGHAESICRRGRFSDFRSPVAEKTSQASAQCLFQDACGGNSSRPVTAARLRRIRTVFPFTRRWRTHATVAPRPFSRKKRFRRRREERNIARKTGTWHSYGWPNGCLSKKAEQEC